MTRPIQNTLTSLAIRLMACYSPEYGRSVPSACDEGELVGLLGSLVCLELQVSLPPRNQVAAAVLPTLIAASCALPERLLGGVPFSHGTV